MRRILIGALVIALVAVLGFGTYTQLYLPSQHSVLTGAPPVRPGLAGNFTGQPVSKPERQQFSAALHDAVATLEPDYDIDTAQLYIARDGYSWAVVRKLSGEYFGRFGFAESRSSRADIDGQTVDYLVWRPNWLHSVFDDRIVLAVALREPRPNSATMVFGYFVLRPAMTRTATPRAAPGRIPGGSTRSSTS